MQALVHYGAKNQASDADKFDILLDDTIDFVQALTIPGKNEA